MHKHLWACLCLYTLQMYVYIFVPFCKEYFVRNIIGLFDGIANYKRLLL